MSTDALAAEPVARAGAAQPRGRPTTGEAARLRHLLLDHAMTLFTERGFDGTTIRDVAEAAGTTRRTVYERYGDKGALFRATFDYGASRLVLGEEALDRVDARDLRSALETFLRLRIAVTMTPFGLLMQRFIHTEGYRFPALVEEIYARTSRPFERRIEALLSRSNAAGITRIADTGLATRSLLAVALGIPIFTALRRGMDDVADLDEHVRLTVDLFLNGFYGGREHRVAIAAPPAGADAI